MINDIIEPLVMVTEVVPGDKVTVTFNTPGYVYFQAVNIEKFTKDEIHKKAEMFKTPLRCEIKAYSEFLKNNK